MKLESIILTILGLIFIIAGFLKYQSTCDLDKPKDLKKLRNMNDLFMIH